MGLLQDPFYYGIKNFALGEYGGWLESVSPLINLFEILFYFSIVEGEKRITILLGQQTNIKASVSNIQTK